ncbi:ferritin-like domain-containing protein [Halomarina halobia]|uniref:Ferritin-like domain-containing protein n=1 Tax=Halomarina halobia TaxID=3033386 RepID=A0ABD6A3W4_9EURY|nr:ferritin-like domain-containing protein [Halomarina sp. PSR21]
MKDSTSELDGTQGSGIDDGTDLGTDRRGFLSTAAKIGGGAALLSFGGTGLAAAADGEGSDDDPSDVEILNYALTLEHLEHAFYRDALQTFDEEDFEGVYSPGAMIFNSPRPRYGTYQRFERIRDDEKAHVDVISQTVEKLGGTPVQEAEYDFPYDDVNGFVGLARTFENLGVAAYAGAAPMIDNKDLLSAALSIHSVEARHAGYLNLHEYRLPYPDAFDPAKTMEEVLAAAGQFIVSDE